MITYKYTIHGRVQGVGFRYFVSRVAEAFDVRGSVRNMPDGSVQILAQGERENLQGFREQVEIGPTGGRVDRVVVETLDSAGRYNGFQVMR